MKLITKNTLRVGNLGFLMILAAFFLFIQGCGANFYSQEKNDSGVVNQTAYSGGVLNDAQIWDSATGLFKDVIAGKRALETLSEDEFKAFRSEVKNNFNTHAKEIEQLKVVVKQLQLKFEKLNVETPGNTPGDTPGTEPGNTTTPKISNRFNHWNPDPTESGWRGKSAFTLCIGVSYDGCSFNGAPMTRGSNDHDREMWWLGGVSRTGGTVICKDGSTTFKYQVNGGSSMQWGQC